MVVKFVRLLAKVIKKGLSVKKNDSKGYVVYLPYILFTFVG